MTSHLHKRRSFHEKNKINAPINNAFNLTNVQCLEKRSDLEITSVSENTIFFNSLGLRKSSSNLYFYVDQYLKKRLFLCENSIGKIFEEYDYEQKLMQIACTDKNSVKMFIIAPRIVHLWLTVPLNKLICSCDVNKNLCKINKKIINEVSLIDAPTSENSIYTRSFDVYGNDYVNKKYIFNGQYVDYEIADQRFVINKGQIKRSLTFPTIEIPIIKDIDISKGFFFYDFVGNVDAEMDYISGILLSCYGNIEINIKWTSFLNNLLGSNGHLSNVKYILSGRSPYLVVNGGLIK